MKADINIVSFANMYLAIYLCKVCIVCSLVKETTSNYHNLALTISQLLNIRLNINLKKEMIC